MRLVIIGPTWPFRGGIAQYTAALATHLSDRHEVTLLSYARQYPRWLFPGRTDRDPSTWVSAPQAEFILDPLNPWTWWRLVRRITALDPDVVLAQWWVPFWAPSLAAVLALVRRRGRVRVVIECHNVLPHEEAPGFDRLLSRLALNRADSFIVHSTTDGQALMDLGLPRAAHQVCVAVPPVDLPPAPARATARARFGLADEVPVALFFGFVRPYKGLDYLLEALPWVLERLPSLRLIVAGEFWGPVADFRQRAAHLGVGHSLLIHDHYVPNEDVADFFVAADVVVLPYVAASQSAVLPLAVRYGRPVVASAVGGLPEVVADGKSGLLVPPADPRALAAALVRLFSEPGLLARLQVGTHEQAARFSWDAVVRAVEQAAVAASVEIGRAVT